MESAARSRRLPSCATSAGRAGHCASERSRRCCPSLVTTGAHSMPSPLVTRVGFADARCFSPQMPPVGILLIGIENHFAAIGRRAIHFQLQNLPGSSESRRPPLERHGIEMRPAITFPGKYQPIARRPEHCWSRGKAVKDTSPPFASFPNLPAYARCHVRNANRPWRAGALGAEQLAARTWPGGADRRSACRPATRPGSWSRSTLGSR